jgi:hypothetical protein
MMAGKEAFLYLVESQLEAGANLLQVDRFGATLFLEDMMPAMTKRS